MIIRFKKDTSIFKKCNNKTMINNLICFDAKNLCDLIDYLVDLIGLILYLIDYLFKV
jgi:hypothetical protein